MLCPRCHGTHVILVNGRRVPCPECQGVGEIHCCDGLTEQPDGPEVRDQKPEVRANRPDTTDSTGEPD